MSNKKISQFQVVTTLNGTTYVPVIQGSPLFDAIISASNFASSMQDYNDNYYIKVDGTNSDIDYLNFNPDAVGNPQPYVRKWSAADGTFVFGVPDGGSIQEGQELFDYYVNADTVPLVNGDVVSIVPIAGNRSAIARTNVTNAQSAKNVIGMVTVPSIAVGATGRITKFGKVRELQTQLYPDGTELFVSQTNAGKWATVAPTPPNYTVKIGTVIVSQNGNGIVELGVQCFPKLGDLSDVNGVESSVNKPIVRKADGVIDAINTGLDINGITPSSGTTTITGDLVVDDITSDVVAANTVNATNVNTTNIESTNGFVKTGSSDNQVLLGAGGTKNVADFQLKTEKGQANGYASLDANGLVPSTQLPSYKEFYNVTTNNPLSAGQYYGLDTALLAIPFELKKKGLIITFESGLNTWKTYQYSDSDVNNFYILSNWYDISADIISSRAKVAIWNATAESPLNEGIYHGLDTAVLSIPNYLKKKGIILTFESSNGIWSTYQYINTDVNNFFVLSNWAKINKSVIKASEIGAFLDANEITATGTDDYAVIQNILDLYGNSPIEFILDGKAAITSTIKLWSNTKLTILDGCGFVLKNNSNCHLLTNKHRDNVNIQDSNITINGGSFYCNGTNQSKYHIGAPQDGGVDVVWNFGVYFLGCQNVKLNDISICDAKSFALTFGNSKDIFIRNYNALWSSEWVNQDTLHLWGNTENVYVDGLRSNGADDVIALNGDEITIFGLSESSNTYTNEQLASLFPTWFSSGYLKNIHIKNVFLDDCYQACRIATSSINNISITDVYGNIQFRESGIGTTNCHGVSFNYGTGNNFDFSNWKVSGSSNILFQVCYLNDIIISKWINNSFKTPSSFDSLCWMLIGDSDLTNLKISDIFIKNNENDSSVLIKSASTYNGNRNNISINNIQSDNFNFTIYNTTPETNDSGFKNLRENNVFISRGSKYSGITNVISNGDEVIDIASSDTKSIGAIIGSSFYPTVEPKYTAFLFDLYKRFGRENIDFILDLQQNHQVSSGSVLHGIKKNGINTGNPTFNANGITFGNSIYSSVNTGLEPLGPVENDRAYTVFFVAKKPNVQAYYQVLSTIGNPGWNNNIIIQPNTDLLTIGSDYGNCASVFLNTINIGDFYFGLCYFERYKCEIAINGGYFGGNINAELNLATNSILKIGGYGDANYYNSDIAIYGIIKKKITNADSQYLYTLIKNTIGSELGLI